MSEREPASLTSLPPEVLLHLFASLDPASLVSAALVSSTISPAAQHVLFSTPTLLSLAQLDAFLVALEQGHHRPRPVPLLGSDDWDPLRALAMKVRDLKIICRSWGSKGWGVKIGGVLRLCGRLRHLVLDGIPDLRIKHLHGVGALLSLSLASTTFRSHSLPTSPHLPQTLASLTSLSLTNLGLPPESTHFAHVLLASSSLSCLTLSYLRDVSPEVFLLGLSHLSNLHTLHLHTLTSPQDAVLSDGLRSLPSLHRVVFAGSAPTFENLGALPASVREVCLGARLPDERYMETAVESVVEALGAGYGRGWRSVEMWREGRANDRVGRAARAARARRGDVDEGVGVWEVGGTRVVVRM